MKEFISAKYDKVNSTFVSRIYFNDGTSKPGYSKKINYTEKRNKLHLIVNWFIRLLENGYLIETNEQGQRAERIEFEYLKTPGDLFLMLFDSHFLIGEKYANNETIGWLHEKLDDIYNDLRQGISVKEIKRKHYQKSRIRNADQLINLKKYNFTSMTQLDAHINYCIHALGVEEAVMQNLKYQYMEVKGGSLK